MPCVIHHHIPCTAVVTQDMHNVLSITLREHLASADGAPWEAQPVNAMLTKGCSGAHQHFEKYTTAQSASAARVQRGGLA